MIKLYDIREISHYLTGDDITKFKNFIKNVTEHGKEGFVVESPSSSNIAINFWYEEDGDDKTLLGAFCSGAISWIESFAIEIYEFEDKIKLTLSGTLIPISAVAIDGDFYFDEQWDLFKILNKAFGVELYKAVKEIRLDD